MLAGTHAHTRVLSPLSLPAFLPPLLSLALSHYYTHAWTLQIQKPVERGQDYSKTERWTKERWGRREKM
jgi:hypothetical protein